jgi:Flp pilus assembly protein CpaB
MSDAQIIILIILALVIGAMFYVAPDIRDAFAEPFGDEIPDELNKGE